MSGYLRRAVGMIIGVGIIIESVRAIIETPNIWIAAVFMIFFGSLCIYFAVKFD